MWTWLMQNLGTLVVGLALLGVVRAVLAGMICNRKKGKSACGCGCDSCPMNGKCR